VSCSAVSGGRVHPGLYALVVLARQGEPTCAVDRALMHPRIAVGEANPKLVGLLQEAGRVSQRGAIVQCVAIP